MSQCLRLAALTCAAIALAVPSMAKDKSPFPKTVREQIGVNIHFTTPKPGEMAMLEAGGFHWARMDFGWEATERTKGVYDFHAYDGLMAELKRRHMQALFILDYRNPAYGPGGAPPYDDEGRTAFARWAAAAAKHFQGQGILWELWNEPNGKWFWPNPNAADYSKLALAADKAIREACPREILIGPALATIELPYLEGCFQAGCLQYWDGVSVHPYRRKDPESVGEDYEKVRALIAKYAPPDKTIPILSGEWGYSVAWNGFDEERQGKYLARELLFNMESGVPLSIWYDWHDDGADPAEGEHHFGTVRNELHPDRTPIYDPKPAYTAAKTLTGVLGDYRFDHKIAAGDATTDHMLEFRKKKDRGYAVWTTSEALHPVTLPIPAGVYTIHDWLGEHRITLTSDKSGLPLTLSDTPQYIVRGTAGRR
ncbi:MAG: Glutamate synthase large chain [Capsulimonas sp.]|nr:Glutamate synthase large chain [Capsulimonas sp.]